RGILALGKGEGRRGCQHAYKDELEGLPQNRLHIVYLRLPTSIHLETAGQAPAMLHSLRCKTCREGFLFVGKKGYLEPWQSAKACEGEKRERGNAVLRRDECVPGGLEAVDTLGG